MRIGINASFARKPNTGIGQVTLNFLKELSKTESRGMKIKNDFEFFLYLEEDLPKKIRLPKIFHKRVFLPIWKRDDLIRKIWWEKFLLPRKIRGDKCDVFISLYQSATIEVSPRKHIMVVHDIIPKLFPEYLNNWRKKCYWNITEKAIKRADKIIAVSRRTEKDLIQHLGIDPAKITVSYIDADEIYKKDVADERSRKIMKKYKLKPGYIYSGGGLEVRKNVEKVIRAYKYLLDKNKKENFTKELPPLVISGRLMPRLAPLVTDAEKLVKELNLTRQIKLLDFVSQEDLPVIYKNALLFIYPSLYEGFGLPVLEAMNQGTPVIASKKSSLPEVGRDGVLYCDPESVDDMAMVIKNILLNKDLRETLSARGKNRAEYFSWSKFVEKIFNIIKSG